MKISATEFNNALLPEEKPGNTIKDSIQVCQWLKDDGVDAIHVSSGASFPHPKNPAGDLPMDELRKTYDSLISSGVLALRNYLLFTGKLTGELFKSRWETARGPKDQIEGLNLPDARAIKQAVGTIPVAVHGRIPDRRHHRGRDRARRLRRGDHRAAAHRQQRSGAAVRPRDRPSRQPVHVLQPVSGERAGESTRLLRRGAVSSREAMIQGNPLSVY